MKIKPKTLLICIVFYLQINTVLSQEKSTTLIPISGSFKIEEVGRYQKSNRTYLGKGFVDINNIKQSEWIYFYEKEIIHSKGSYINGKKNGEWIYYVKNQPKEVRYIKTYKEGILHGQYLDTFGHDNRFSIGGESNDENGNYINGIKEGEWITYQNNTNIKLSSRSYNNGNLTKQTLWYNNEKPYLEFDYTKFKGSTDLSYIKAYYPNGNRMFQGGFIDNGVKDGLWKIYYKNGIVYSEGQLRAGSYNYTTNTHFLFDLTNDFNGKYEQERFNRLEYLLFYSSYRSSKIGEWKKYHKNGSLALIEVYCGSLRTGKAIHYHPNGKIYSKGDYKLVEEIVRNGTQRQLKESDCDFNNKENFLSMRNNNINSHKDGQWKTYYENGNINSITAYNALTYDQHKDFYSSKLIYNKNGYLIEKHNYSSVYKFSIEKFNGIGVLIYSQKASAYYTTDHNEEEIKFNYRDSLLTSTETRIQHGIGRHRRETLTTKFFDKKGNTIKITEENLND